MLNPYVLLAQFVGLLIAIFGAYQYGYSRAEDAVSARVAAAQEQAIDQANRDAKAATARTVAQAKAEAAARVRAAGIRRKGEIDATVKARPDCARDAESMGLLQSAIAAANDSETSSSTMPDSMRPTPNTTRRLGP